MSDKPLDLETALEKTFEKLPWVVLKKARDAGTDILTADENGKPVFLSPDELEKRLKDKE
jgi:hypothetical protein